MPDEPKRPPTAAPPRRLARLWRWTWRGALVLVALVVFAVAGALVFVESDAGRDLARESAAEQGLALDYGSLELSPFSGEARLGALRLPMPERCRTHGEDWLTVERVDVRWDAGEALAGRLRDVRVLVEGVGFLYAIDAEGTDCLQLALQSLLGEDAPTEPAPLSQSLAALTLPPELAGIEVASLEVRNVRARFVDAREGLDVQIEGPTLQGHAREEGGVLRGELVLGSADEGLRVRANENEARLAMEQRIVLGGGVSGDEITLTSATTLHTLELEAPLIDVDALRLPRELLTLEAAARFEPDAARTSVQVTRLAVLGDVATGQGGVTLPDEGRLTIAPSSIDVDLDSLAAAIPELVDLALDDVRATARATPVDGTNVSAGSTADADEVRFELDARAGRVALPEERAVVQSATANARGTWRGEHVSFDVEVRADAIAGKDADTTLAGRAMVLDAHATEVALDGTSGAASVTLGISDLSVDAGDLRASLASLALTLEAPSVREPTVTLTTGALDVRSGSTRAQLPSLALSAAAHELHPSFAVPVGFEGTLRTPRIGLDADGLQVTPRDIAVAFDGTARSPAELDVRTHTRVAAIEARQDALTARVDGLDLRLALNELALPAVGEPEGPRATLVVDGRTRRVDLRDALQHVAIDGLGLSSRAPIAGGIPARLTGRIPLGNVRYATADREPTPIVEHGELAWTLSELRLDPVLARSSARLSAELQLWPMAGAEPVETPEEIAARDRRRARLIAEADARGEEPPTFEDGPRERTLRAGVRARFDRGAGELDVELRGRTVAMIAPLLGLDELALERARANLTLHGTYAGLDRADPTIAHRGELRLRRIGLRGEGGAPLVFPRIVATLDHTARAAIHDATLRLEIEPPTLGEETLPHGVTLVTTARADLQALSIHTETRSENAGDMSFALDVDANLEADGTLVHRERLVAEGLRGLSQWLPPEVPVRVDSAQIDGEGRVLHAIDAAAPSFEQTVAARLATVSYAEGEVRATLPEVRFEAQLRGDPSGHSGESAVHLPLVDVLDGLHHVTFHGAEQRVRWASRGPIEDDSTGSAGSAADFALDVHIDSELARVEQDFVAAYPMEGVTLDVDLAIDGARSVRMDHFALVNERGGTRLEMNKTLDRGSSFALDASEDAMATDEAVEGDLAHEGVAVRRTARRGESLVLRGRLEQDLSRLDGAPEDLVARGRVVVPFSLESGDGSLFRAHARAELDDVHVALPALGIVLEGVRANVPVEEAFALRRSGPEGSAGGVGLELVANTERSAFARVRHQDLQALLDGETFVEVRRLRVGEVELGPLVGSLFVDRNVFALEGVRVQRDDALITGQVLVDYLPGRERVTFRGNITGLRTRTSRQPLDANCAVVFTPSRLELDGRVQIVRVATAHLRGLLDLLDPYREDPSFNSLRSVLRFAHPNRVTLDLSQGLMSLEVELGGVVGRFLDVSAIRGIPLGPFMNRHVAPLLGRED
ncbi:MAG: hypothetical protein MUE69_00785 [Myxococcota bacterium]|nr:hypothetical protein [Myxococcota bacterium]